MEYLEGAHQSNRGRANWQSSVIPNWPHLRQMPNIHERYDCIQVNAVEGVYLVAPESGAFNHYWAINQSDSCLWHERYEDTGTGEEGCLDNLELDAFAHADAKYGDGGGSGSSSGSSSSSSSEEDDSSDCSSSSDEEPSKGRTEEEREREQQEELDDLL